MADRSHVTEVRFKSASPKEVHTGLLGWVSCTLNGTFYLDGITVRRTRNGRLALSFPMRHDVSGREHFYFRPVGDDARRQIEHGILSALGLKEELTR